MDEDSFQRKNKDSEKQKKPGPWGDPVEVIASVVCTYSLIGFQNFRKIKLDCLHDLPQGSQGGTIFGSFAAHGLDPFQCPF